jgi:hypothetical protein
MLLVHEETTSGKSFLDGIGITVGQVQLPEVLLNLLWLVLMILLHFVITQKLLIIVTKDIYP